MSMEWPDFAYIPLEEPHYNVLPSQFEMDNSGWSFEENKLFENGISELRPGSPGFFENLASKVPWKPIEDIRNHYRALIEDLETIESGNFPLPDYKECEKHEEIEGKKDEGSASSHERKAKNGQQRRRGVPWTEEEHQLFLMGLNRYGRGDWRSISRYYVISKTPTQVASHAQKYFRRQASSTPADRRRPSIHDVHAVNPTSMSASLCPHTLPGPLTSIVEPNPFWSDGGGFNFAMVNDHFNGGGIVGQNPNFLQMESGFPSVDPVFFQQSGANYPSSFLF